VDTSIAHLAGALGKPCWVLLQAIDTDWRWGLEGSGTAWYPGMRLFRQARAQDWGAVIGDAAAALDAWARPRAQPSRRKPRGRRKP
jgi:hypothetical protein